MFRVSICFQLLCLFAFNVSAADRPAQDQVLATQEQGAITVDEYELFLRERTTEIRSKAPNFQDHDYWLSDLAFVRILAASGEAQMESLKDFPPVRWLLWENRTSKATRRLAEIIQSRLKEPTAAGIKTYYEANQKRFEIQALFSFRNIFFDATRCAGSEERKELEAKAQAVRNSLSADPSKPAIPLDDFQRAAAAATGKATAVLEVRGPFAIGKINPAIEQAAMSLEPGQISGVVSTPQGFQILRCEHRTLYKQPSLEEASKEIRQILRDAENAQRWQEFLQQHAGEDRMVVHQSAIDALMGASTDLAAHPIPLAEAGKLNLSTKDFGEYLYAKSRLMVSRSLEVPEEISEGIRENIKKWLLIPQLVTEAGDAGDLVTDATYQKRLQMGRRIVLAKEILRQAMKARIDRMDPIPDSEVEAYYRTHEKEFMTTREFRLREIAVQPKPAETPPEKEMALRAAEAQALAAVQLIQSGSPEDAVVRKFSSGEEAAQGGVTDWLIDSARYPEEVWRKVSSLSKGEWTQEAFRVENIVVVLKLEDEKPSVLKPLAEASADIRTILERERVVKVHAALREQRLKASGFQLNPEAVARLVPIAERFAMGGSIQAKP